MFIDTRILLKIKVSLQSAVAIGLFTLSASTHAAMYYVSGTITFKSGDSGVIDSVGIGEAYTAVITVRDSVGPDQDPSATRGVFLNAVTSFDVTIGGELFSIPLQPSLFGSSVSVFNDRFQGGQYLDGWGASMQGFTSVPSNSTVYSATLTLYDRQPTPSDVITTDAYQTALPALALFNGPEITLAAYRGSLATFAFGNVSYFGVSPEASVVPIPAAAWLMLSGLGAIVAVTRRRTKHASA